VHAVVRLLAVDLGGESRNLGVVGLHELCQPLRVGLFVQVVARDRLLPVEQAQLDEA